MKKIKLNKDFGKPVLAHGYELDQQSNIVSAWKMS
jgi:hypothetical protein